MSPFYTPARVRIHVGEPIDLTPYLQRDTEKRDKSVLEDLTRRMLREIAALGGATDYEPELAGKVWGKAAEEAELAAAEQPAATESDRLSAMDGDPSA